MNDFSSQVLEAMLNHLKTSACTNETLLSSLRIEFDEDLQEYEINPIIEKAIELDLIIKMSNGELHLTRKAEGVDLETFWRTKSHSTVADSPVPDEVPYTSEFFNSLDELVKSHDLYVITLKKYLKSLLIAMNPYHFEELVIDILIKINEAPFGEVTRKSGDGGIDGFL